MKYIKYFSVPLLLVIVLVWIELFIKNGAMLLQINPTAMDFLAFYTGGSILLHNPHQLYNLHSQSLTQVQIDPKSAQLFLPFLNPPFVALFFAPLTYFPLLFAYSLFVIFNTILLIIFCVIALRLLNHYPLYVRIVSLIGIVFFIPVLTSLLIGQLSFIIALLFLLTWLLLRKKREFVAGLIFALVLIKPHFFVLPFIAFLIQRRYKVVGGMITGTILLLITSFLCVGFSGLNEYFHLLTQASSWNSTYGIDLNSQHSLQTFLMILFPWTSVTSIKPFWFIGVLFLCLPLLWIWRKKVSYLSTYFSLSFALLLIVTLLTSLHTHFHDLILQLVIGLALATALPQLQTKEKKMIETFIVIGYFLLLTGYIGEVNFIVGFHASWILLSVSYMLILCITLVLLLRRQFGILPSMNPLHTITGKVTMGAKRGRDLGFPTANVPTTQNISEGIYASETILGNKTYQSATFIGSAKTFDETEWKSETYILNFNENIYDKKLTIKLYKKLRDNKKFISVEKLVQQMKKDILQTKAFFQEEK